MTKARLIYLLTVLALVAYFVACMKPGTSSDGASAW